MEPSLFRLEAYFEEYEHVEGMNVLGSSDARNLSLGELLRITGAQLPPELGLGYTPPAGTPELIDAIAALYGVATERVLVTAGANEAVFLAVTSALRAGDHALVCRPAYQSLTEAVRLADAEVVTYDYDAQTGFTLDVGALVETIATLRPALVILNTPHNPTGKLLADSDLERILAAAAAAGSGVLVDEVMHGIVHESAARPRSAASVSDRAIVIGSMSKVYGLGGLRIGWIVAPPDVVLRCKRWRYYTTICPPVVAQTLAAAALRHAAEIVGANEATVRENYRVVRQWLETVGERFDAVPPEGGTVMLLRLRDGENAQLFARALAEREKIFLVPCDATFGMPDGWLRLGLGPEPQRFRAGLEGITRFVQRTDGR
jgi:aspartate/methionine/tyrosine aminotransferase